VPSPTGRAHGVQDGATSNEHPAERTGVNGGEEGAAAVVAHVHHCEVVRPEYMQRLRWPLQPVWSVITVAPAETIVR
jgi:hypothetical protein